MAPRSGALGSTGVSSPVPGHGAVDDQDSEPNEQDVRWSVHLAMGRVTPLRKVAVCRRLPAAQGAESVPLRGVLAADGTVSSLGPGAVQTCATWHSCMAGCSAKIAKGRADDLEHAIRVWEALGGTVVQLVLSARHHRGHTLRELVEAQREGRKAVVSDRPWRAERQELGIRFALWGFEATYGDEHGWHPHHHVTLFCDRREWTTERVAWGTKGQTREKLVAPIGAPVPVVQEHAERVLARTWRRWRQGLARKGVTAVPYVFRDGRRESVGMDVTVMNHGEAYGQYPYKMALEAVGAYWKRGRGTPVKGHRSRTPFEVMTDYAVAASEGREDDAAADAAVLQEWSQTMTDMRVRQCAWPPGMRAWFAEKAEELGIAGPLLEEELTDQELADAESPEAETLGHMRPGEWRDVVSYELDTLRRAGRTGGIAGIVAWFEVRGLTFELPRDDHRHRLGDARDDGGRPPP